jgi:class 3 adenylate cyclase
MTKICNNCQKELPADARFCMNCGQPIAGTTPSDEQRRQRLAAAAPQDLVEKARAANRLSGERRIVTALFIDVVGSRLLSKQMGQLVAEEIIYAGLDLACPIIYKYEGTIAHLQDDEMLVFFGAPVAHEDDPVRAVRAGLEILEVIQAFAQTVRQERNIDFAVRIALSTGPVKIGLVGDDLRYQYSALGGTLNLAAQLEAIKLANCVLISESTHRFIAPFCNCEDLGELAIPPGPGGASTRFFNVKSLQAVPGQLRGLAGLHSPMVGRTHELAVLVQLSQAVQAGLGRAVLIQGEPGMGKTRLIREWQSAVQASSAPQAIKWIQGNSYSYDRATPYHLVFSLLRSLIQTPETANEPETRAAYENLLDQLFPAGVERLEVHPYLGQLLGIKIEGEPAERLRHLDPEGFMARGQEAMRRLLIRLASRQPLVIIMEDLHWADPSSVNFLSPLLALAATEPILICLVMRPERESDGRRLLTTAREALGDRLSSITLEALNPNDSRQLVTNLLEIETLPDAVRELILEKAEGNPFFVEEVIRMLIDRGAIINMNGHWQSGVNIADIEIPDNLQGLLLARIDRLPEDVKQTLRIAAVIGRQFPLRVLEYILDPESPGRRSNLE